MKHFAGATPRETGGRAAGSHVLDVSLGTHSKLGEVMLDK